MLLAIHLYPCADIHAEHTPIVSDNYVRELPQISSLVHDILTLNDAQSNHKFASR